ncbi:hypothetical protein [Halomicrococcus sp. NG-SE-24]|uniref:hypothetical protein n=1 Tax=Halomicrococcus sp. NG-SE-24 TaxID=3436928 RepID=UPI003D981470
MSRDSPAETEAGEREWWTAGRSSWSDGDIDVGVAFDPGASQGDDPTRTSSGWELRSGVRGDGAAADTVRCADPREESNEGGSFPGRDSDRDEFVSRSRTAGVSDVPALPAQ